MQFAVVCLLCACGVDRVAFVEVSGVACSVRLSSER